MIEHGVALGILSLITTSEENAVVYYLELTFGKGGLFSVLIEGHEEYGS